MTIKDVSKMTGLSSATISRVLNNDQKVSPKTREAVEKAIAELNYVPNLLGRNLRRVKTETIYLLLPSIDNPFFSEIVLGIESAAQEVNYRVVICETFNRAKRYMSFIDAVKKKVVDGLIFISPSLVDVIPSGEEMPIVVCGESHESFDCLQVDIDNEKAAYDAVSYLIKSGRKKIVYAGGSYTSGVLREKGYRHALEDAGIKVDEDLIIQNSYHYVDGRNAIKKLTAAGKAFDAVFAASDLIAIGIIRQLEREGLKVPGDIAVMGFDNLDYAEMNSPSLSTVMQPRVEMGKAAFKLLYDTLAGEEKRTFCRTFLDHKIIERYSTLGYNNEE